MTYHDLYSQWTSDLSFISAQTSGSTGAPTHIKLPKGLVRQSALRTIDFFNLDSSSHLYSCISPDYIGGKMMMIRALLCGARFSYETPSNRPFSGISSHEIIDLVSVVPSQMRHILDNPDTLPSVRNYLIGGSSIPSSIRNEIISNNLSAYESYGMTETASHIAIRRLSIDDLPFSPLPGIKTSLDHRGCLVINLGKYGYITTNDLVRLHPDGSFHILGRADHVIISGGKKVNPAEIENAISHLFLGSEISVTSRPHPLWTNQIVVLVESADNDFDFDSIRQQMRFLLQPHEVPKEIIRVDRLPRTPSGKIIRKPIS